MGGRLLTLGGRQVVALVVRAAPFTPHHLHLLSTMQTLGAFEPHAARDEAAALLRERLRPRPHRQVTAGAAEAAADGSDELDASMASHAGAADAAPARFLAGGGAVVLPEALMDAPRSCERQPAAPGVQALLPSESEEALLRRASALVLAQ